MPLETKNWRWKESAKASKVCARESIRTLKAGKKTLLRVCCPKGAYRKGRCTRGTRLIAKAQRR